MTLRTAVLLLGTVCAILLTAAMASIVYFVFPAEMERQLEVRALGAGGQLARQVVPLLLVEDAVSLSRLLDSTLAGDRDMRYVVLLDTNGRPLLSTFRAGVPAGLLALYANPAKAASRRFRSEDGEYLDAQVPLSGGVLGALRIGIDRRPILAFVRGNLLWLTVVLGGVLLLTAAGSWWIGGLVGGPLARFGEISVEVPSRYPARDEFPASRLREIELLASAFGRMVSNLRTAETEREQLHRRTLVAERLATVGHLSAGVVHEISNPLDGAIEIGRYLEEDPEPTDRMRRFLPLLGQAHERIRTIVRQLLVLAGNREKLTIRPCKLRDLVGSTGLLFQRTLEGRGIRLEVNPGESPKDCVAQADPQALSQVLANLIRNAADAAPERCGRIRVSTRCNDGHVLIDVEDNGSGVGPLDAAHLFEPFFTTKEIGKGTGLGLTIARSLVERCGGDLVLRAGQGELGGACFQVSLPRSPCAGCEASDGDAGADPRR